MTLFEFNVYKNFIFFLDFNILGTTRKDLVGDRYVAAEFEDGTTRPLFKRKLQKTIVEGLLILDKYEQNPYRAFP